MSVAIRPARSRARPLAALAAQLDLGVEPESRQVSTEPAVRAAEASDRDVAVCGITHDSRAVCPGDLYAALPGRRVHGAAFCDDATAAGAVAILTDADGRERAIRCGIPVLVAADPRAVLGEVASWVYGEPSVDLCLIGVTGTSGKTTTSYLVESGLRAAGHRTGLVGGVETRVGRIVRASELTTPEATDLQALLAVMVEHGVTAAAMEVSSHALSLGRVGGTSYDVAVFTNLSQDHLDFHPDIESYFAAKASLFTHRYARVAVVNRDDPHGRRLADSTELPVVTFSAAGDPAADWRAERLRVGTDGSTFRVLGPGGATADATVRLPGPFNVANALAAVAALVTAGIDLAAAVSGVAACPGVPGRLERVTAGYAGNAGAADYAGGAGRAGTASGRGSAAASAGTGQDEDGSAPTVFVDYSHKPGAVEAVLRALRPIARNRLVVVLGCGGDRDTAKRPLMGAAAAELADVAIFTSDNPRSEDPVAILAAMLDGALSVPQRRRAHMIVEPDRAAAVDYATALAGAGDVILVAGKGHERGQQFADRVVPFDDREAVAAALRRRHGVEGDVAPPAAARRGPVKGRR